MKTNRVLWQTDTRGITPRTLQIMRGEAVEIGVDLVSYGVPVDVGGATCSAFWRSPDMASGAGWYTSPATCSGNRVSWVWDGATMDAGADTYEWYIGVDGDGLSYRPCGRIQMLGSPAGNPSAIPIPSPVLDFAKYTVVNSPFPTFAEEGAAINSATSGKVDTSALVETLEDYYTATQTETAIEAATSALVGVSALSAYWTGQETSDAIQSATSALASVEWVGSAIAAETSGKADASALGCYLPLSGGTMGVGGTLAFGGQQGSRGAVWMDGVTLTVSNRDPGGALSRYAFSPFNIDAVAKKSDVDAGTSGKADRADLALYLPISGGANAGTIAWDTPYMLKTTRADLRLYNGYLWLNNTAIAPRPATEQAVQLTLPQRDGRLALVSDVDAATSGKADASALSAYYTSAQTDTAISTAITSAIGDIDTVLDGINGEVI